MIAITELPKPRQRNGRNGRFSLEAQDVTGVHKMVINDLESSTPAGVVASALAARMMLPDTIPWVLRDEQSGAYLADELPIGDQLGERQEGEGDLPQVSITPRAHLGGGR
jgi:hypothetical protein